jgi:hypothetical protein
VARRTASDLLGYRNMAAVEPIIPGSFDSLQRHPSAADRVDGMDKTSGSGTTPAPALERVALLDEMLEELAGRKAGRQQLDLEIAHGRRVEVAPSAGGSVLRVRRPDGAIEITIEVAATGPIVRVDAAALEVACSGNVAVDCGSLEVRAAHRIELTCERGDVRLDAGDDIVVTGERIQLN